MADLAMSSRNHVMERVESCAGIGRAMPRRTQLHVSIRLRRGRALDIVYCVDQSRPEIGLRLMVSEQTVKFHLRHIFIKFGVRRRAELISRLLL